MRRFLVLLLLPCYSSQAETKSLSETDDAYILDVDLDEKKTGAVGSTQTKVLSTGNTLVDGAVVGLGVGVLGSLLVGNFLEHQKKKNCLYRRRRDSANPASTRFLPPVNCPPPPYPSNNYHHPVQHNNYQPQNIGYNPPKNVYHPPQPVNTYNPPRPVNTYNPPRPLNTYNPPPPLNTYNPPRPVNVYHPPQPLNTYNPPQHSVYQPQQPQQNPTNVYRPPPSSGYQPAGSSYIPAGSRGNSGSFSQAEAHKPTPAPFNFGVGK